RPDPVQGAPEAPADPTRRDRPDRTSEELSGVGATGRPVLGRRDAGQREQALARYGGDEASEGAVQAALAWLARHQAGEGGFEAAGFQRRCAEEGACWGKGQAQHDTGVTGLALLAFLGAGHTDRQGSHAEVVRRALDRALELQRPDGCYDPAEPGDLYNHGITTLAVSEAYAMTREGRHAASARRALAYTASAQQRGGGWDYTAAPTDRNDLSVTGWQVMALKSAHLAGLKVPEEVLLGARRFLDSATRSTGAGVYADRGVGEGREGVGMVAVSLLSRLYLGRGPEGATSRRQVSTLLRNLPDWGRMERGEGFQTLYYWYYGTLALFHVGGEPWERWNDATRGLLVARQRQGGEADGSWDPSGQWIGRVGGRVYATALNAMTLEVYYRYLPLFEEDPDLVATAGLDSALGLAVSASDPSDRLRALESLPRDADARVLRALDQALEDREGRVRDAARDRLVAIGGPAVVPPLARGLSSEDLTRRWQSVRALATVAGPGAAAALARALADPANAPLVPSILEALGACDDPASVETILPWLDHADPSVAAAARSALDRLRPEAPTGD
ncbi:MAG: HEAT repeat domain-containing protein, partial [Planctomycetes bacterium]|nr:HEAT repeat domain-containing protein [Planctomycetota bacterium]